MPIHGYPGGVITANPTAPTSSVASGVWTTEQQLAAVAAGNWPFTIPTQQISRSLRFNSADTPSLSRTPGSAGNRQKFTISVWYKACGISTSQSNANIINAGGDGSSLVISGTAAFGATYDNRLLFREAGTTLFYWPMVFRDPSAWYHIVFAMDTTQATAANRAKLYVNGVDQGAFSGTAISQNTSTSINNTSAHSIGLFNGSYPNNLYYAEYYLIDGQQVAASSFGRNNIDTGVWEPLAYTGTYGTNGFYLNFSDNSGTTSTTLGKDTSGNGNNWTPNNFSVTAGAGNDSLVDSPTSYGTDTGVGGEVRGNYATYNSAGSAPSVTLTNGNLDASHGAFSSTTGAASTFGVSSGKWYWEVTINAISSGAPFIGIVRSDQLYPFTTLFANNSQGYAYRSNGQKRNNSTDTAYGASYTNGDVIGVALDMDAGTIVFYKNNTSQGTAFSSLSGTFIPIDANGTSGGTYTSTINFGQRAFAYTAPSGFKALCTQNLPTPTIGATSTTQANDYFNVVLYTGNGGTQTVSGVGFQPDFVWAKGRSVAYSNRLYDVIRGATKSLVSNNTDGEATLTTQLTAFASDGFTLGSDVGLNQSSATYVAWNWKANGAGSSNTAGTITSTVSANTTSGFSIVTYTGTGSNATVGHGLGVAPSMVIVKRRNGTGNWCVYSASLTSAAYALFLETTDAQAIYTNIWNSTAPTSTVFSVGNSLSTNSSSQTYVAYCFAPVAGYSAFGSYTGNGSTDGPFVYTGFRPAYVMIKYSSGTADWIVLDKSRPGYNVIGGNLYPNGSYAEDTQTKLDLTSNGFKIRADGSNANVNVSSGTYIYMAFAENPFKYALAR